MHNVQRLLFSRFVNHFRCTFFRQMISDVLQQNPALLFAIFFALGILYAFIPYSKTIICCLIVFGVCLKNTKQLLIISLSIFTIAMLYANQQYKFPDNHQKLRGKGYFRIQTLRYQSSFFFSSYVYEGVLSSFYAEDVDEFYHNIPCKIFLKTNRRFMANRDYLISGELTAKRERNFIFKIDRSILPQANENSFSTAEMRFVMKKAIKNAITRKVNDRELSSLFSTLITGETADLLLSYHFRKLGLSHLLVISGFHFALLAMCIGAILYYFLSEKIASISLLFLLIIYESFLGPSPSSERASLVIYFYLIGRMFSRKASPINLLGLAMLIQLIKQPIAIFHIGFQLSYAATFAIFSLTPFFENLLAKICPQKNYRLIKQAPKRSQYIYLLCMWWQKQAALMLAVNSLTTPLILYYFYDIPLLSFVYNLLVTPLISLCFILTMFAFVPGLSIVLLPILTAFARFALDIIIYAPKSLDLHFRSQAMTTPPSTMVIAALFMLGLIAYGKTLNKMSLSAG